MSIDTIARGLAVRNVPRSLNLVAPLGDSRVAQIELDSTLLNKSASNHFPWANALSGNRAVLAGNWGVSGDRTDQVLARLGTAIASGAGILYIHCGVNDIAQTIPSATTSGTTAFANIQLMAQAGVAAGMKVIVTLDPGAANFNAAQIGQLNILNQLIREFGETMPNVVLFDLPAALWNATNAASAIAFKPGYMRDVTHEDSAGAFAGGLAFAPILQALMPARPFLARNIIENGGNTPFELLTNPLFGTPSGGTLGAGATGTIPSGCTAQRGSGGSGSASVACSTGTPADGSPGNECILNCTFNGASDELRLFQSPSNTVWNAGDILQASCTLSVDAGASGLAGAYLYLSANFDATGLAAADLQPVSTSSLGPQGGYSVTLQTNKLIVPALTTKSFLTSHIKVIGAAAGGATVRVRQWSVRKRFS